MSSTKVKVIESYDQDYIDDLILSTHSGETRFLSYIKDGRYQDIENEFKNTDIQLIVGKMSNDAIRQLRYAAVSGVTLFSRVAIAGGMYQKESLALSDKFIQTIDQFQNTDDIIKALFEVMITYAKAVHDSKLSNVSTPIVFRAANYIHNNLEKKISSASVAKQVHCSEQYLGKLFKKELNTSISQFILKEKIEKAIILMKEDKIPVNEIPYQLSFCSQSHFIQSFKKVTGTTPAKYKTLINGFTPK